MYNKAKMHKYSRILRQFIFFGIVGVISLIIDVGITTALYDLLHFPAYLASSLGFLSGFLFNFPMNRSKVFKHAKNDKFSLRIQLIMYFALSGFNLLVTGSVVHYLVESVNIHIEYAKIFVTVIIAVWNFALFRLVIFSKNNSTKS